MVSKLDAEVLLVFEVMIERPFGDADGFQNVVYAGIVEAPDIDDLCTFFYQVVLRIFVGHLFAFRICLSLLPLDA